MYRKNAQLDKLMSKNGISCVLYSQMLLFKSPGDRIETVEHYANEFKVGRGTIQFAMKFLSEYGAVVFESRGHKGTYVVDIDYNKLFEISGIKSITCSMPLPYTLRYEGLATGLYEVFDKTSISFNIAYVRGSFNRINNLIDGKVDFTIVSNYAAYNFIKENDDIVLIEELDDYTFVGKRALLFREKDKFEIEDGMRIALDETSMDQIALTKYLCKDKKVDFIKISYNQIYNYLNNNRIDVAVWNGDEFSDRKISGNTVYLKDLAFNDTKASLVGLKQNESVNTIIKKFLNKDVIQDIQCKVLNREMIPIY